MGFWSTELYRRLLRLSNLIIDTDKDWGGHIIKNLGAPVDPNDVLRKAELDNHKSLIPIDHPDNSITAEKIDPSALVREYASAGNFTYYLEPRRVYNLPYTGKVLTLYREEGVIVSKTVSVKKAFVVAIGAIMFTCNESGYYTGGYIRIYVDGTKVKELNCDIANYGEWSGGWTFYVGELAEGDHTIEVRAYGWNAEGTFRCFGRIEVFKLG